MAAINATTYTELMKTRYSKEKIEDETWKDLPLHAMLKKKEDYSGKSYLFPVLIDDPAGVSQSLSAAIAAASAGVAKDYTINLSKFYGAISIDGLTLEVAEGKEGAFIDAQSYAFDRTLKAVTTQIAMAEYGDGSNSIGRVASVDSGVITLSLKEDARKFGIGQKIIAATAKTGGTDRSGTGTVTGVNLGEGKVTYSGTITSLANNDYLFLSGNKDVTNKFYGLAAWFPETAPTSGDNFMGVDRSVAPERLAGNRVAALGSAIEEALIDASAITSLMGGNPDIAILGYTKWRELVKAIGSKVQYVNASAKATVGFRAVEVAGMKSVMKVMADVFCPENRGYVLTSNTLELQSAGSVPFIEERDGVILLRSTSEDEFNVQIKAYCQLVCRAPGFNSVLLFDVAP